MTRILLFLAFLMSGLTVVRAVAAPLPTPLEAASYSRISTSTEMADYLRALAARHPETAQVDVLGKSVEGRDLVLLRLSKPGPATASPRPRVMIVGSQHGAAEPAGGEALLVIARELLEGDRRALLDDLDFLLLPNANPDGRDLGRRSNANRINLNIDFVKLTQPENRVLREALYHYQPHALLDSHESAVLKRQTLAKEGYLTDFNAQFEHSNNPAVPAALRRYAREDFLPAINARVSEGGLPAHRYIGEITRIGQPITHGGLTLRNFRNTTGMSGALAILVETKLDSKEDPWPTYRNIKVRVERQLLCLHSFIDLVHERRANLLPLVEAARQALHREPLTLFAGYERDATHPSVEIPMRRLDTRALEQVTFPDHRKQVDDQQIPFPPMIAITRHMDAIQPVLERHGIRHWELDEETGAEVIATRVRVPANIVERAEVLEETRKTLVLEPGSLIIDTAQLGGRIAPLLLEPRSTSSIFRYPEFAALVKPEEEFFVYRTYKGAARSQP
jgi:hypothetical protein